MGKYKLIESQVVRSYSDDLYFFYFQKTLLSSCFSINDELLSRLFEFLRAGNFADADSVMLKIRYDPNVVSLSNRAPISCGKLKRAFF